MVVGDLATAVDVVVLGAGPGGYVAAIRLGQLGRKVAIIDPGPPGGTCLNEGCIPSKALLSAADNYWRARSFGEMGVCVDGVRVDFGRMQAWKGGIVERLTKGVRQLLEGYGVQLVHGLGWFLAEKEVRVEGENGSLRYSFDNCIIAVGAAPAGLPGLDFDGERVLTPAQALQLPDLPAHLTVVGADYVAAEIATIFGKLGVPVRLLIPAGRKLLDDFDPTAGRMVQAGLKKIGVAIEMNVGDPEARLNGEHPVVVSLGVAPRTKDLHLHTVHVETDDSGFLPVDAQLRTNNPIIYAVGDVTGGVPLATVAIKQGKVAAETIAGVPAQYAPQAVPKVVWSEPSVAAVGMTAAEAEAAGFEIATGRFPLAASGRALTLASPDGSVLTVAEKETGVLLGATIIGARAGELIGEVALAMEMGATLTDLAETLHPHPGLPETVQESAEAALGAAVHLLKPTGA